MSISRYRALSGGLLTLALVGCTADPPAPPPPPARFVLVPDLCERINHESLGKLTGGEVRSGVTRGGSQERTRCEAASASAAGPIDPRAVEGSIATATIDVNILSTPAQAETALREGTQPTANVGEAGQLELGDYAEFRYDPLDRLVRYSLKARQGNAVISVLLNISDTPLPERAPVEEIASTYVTQAWELMRV